MQDAAKELQIGKAFAKLPKPMIVHLLVPIIILFTLMVFQIFQDRFCILRVLKKWVLITVISLESIEYLAYKNLKECLL